MAARPDVRLADAPMQPVTCHTCEGQVEARKSSWDQTTIQWTPETRAACVERRASSPRPGANGATFTGCSALRDSVREAAVMGELDVLSDEPLKSNPAAEDEVHSA